MLHVCVCVCVCVCVRVCVFNPIANHCQPAGTRAGLRGDLLRTLPPFGLHSRLHHHPILAYIIFTHSHVEYSTRPSADIDDVVAEV